LVNTANWLRQSLIATSVVMVVFAAAAAFAQDATPGGAVLEEVIVTAQKRAENLQDVPIAITALTGAALQDRHISNIQDLDLAAPNLKTARAGGISYVFIRGIGNTFLTGGDGSIAFNQDGVYFARHRAQVVGLYDLERVEVLRGPQGTLYGRNATGGSINVVSKRPSGETSGYFTVTGGNFARFNVEGAVGGSLSADSGTQGRIAMRIATHDGFGKEITSGAPVEDQNEKAIRGSLLQKFSDDASLLLIGDYFTANDHAGAWHVFGTGRPDVPLTGLLLGGKLPASFWDISSDSPPSRKVTVWGVNATLDWSISDHVSFKSITAYRRSHSYDLSEYDGTNIVIAPGAQTEDADQFSEELHLRRTGDRTDLMAGAYYLHEKQTEYDWIRLPLFDAYYGNNKVFFIQDGTVPTDAYALFGNAIFKLTSRTSITGGVRYSYEKRSSRGTFTVGIPGVSGVPIDTGKHWSAFTPKVSIEHHPADDVLLYASVGRGFKSGTFQAGTLNPAINPEYVTSYELGIKSTLAGGRVRANVAAFYYDYTDLQVTTVRPGPLVVVENAASARIDGLEAEIEAKLWEGAEASLNVAYLDSRFKKYLSIDPVYAERGTQDLAGNQLPTAPKGQVSASLKQAIPLGERGSLTLQADIAWTDDVYFDAYNNANSLQKANTISNLRAGYSRDGSGWNAALWVHNLTNAKVIATSVISSDFMGYPRLGNYKDPRTWGADVSYRF